MVLFAGCVADSLPQPHFSDRRGTLFFLLLLQPKSGFGFAKGASSLAPSSFFTSTFTSGVVVFVAGAGVGALVAGFAVGALGFGALSDFLVEDLGAGADNCFACGWAAGGVGVFPTVDTAAVGAAGGFTSVVVVGRVAA